MFVEVNVPANRELFEKVGKATTKVVTDHADQIGSADIKVASQNPRLRVRANARLDPLLEQYGKEIIDGVRSITIDRESNLTDAFNLAHGVACRLDSPINLNFNHNLLAIDPYSTISEIAGALGRAQELRYDYGDLVLRGYGNPISLSYTAVALAQYYSRRVVFSWDFGKYDNDGNGSPEHRLIFADPRFSVKEVLTQVQKGCVLIASPSDEIPEKPVVRFEVPTIGQIAEPVFAEAVLVANEFPEKNVEIRPEGMGRPLEISPPTSRQGGIRSLPRDYNT